MADQAQENPAVVAGAGNAELDRIAETFAKVKEFLEADEFTLGDLPPNNLVTPTRKAALSSWKNYYKNLVMKTSHILQRLYPALDQCEAIDTDTLKTEKFQLVRQLHGLKTQYNSEFQALLDKLSNVAYDVLLRGFGGTLSAHQERRLGIYFMELNIEVSTKITRLQEMDSEIGNRYTVIMTRVEFIDIPVQGLVADPLQGPGQQLPRDKYSPIPTFLEQGGNKDRS